MPLFNILEIYIYIKKKGGIDKEGNVIERGVEGNTK